MIKTLYFRLWCWWHDYCWRHNKVQFESRFYYCEYEKVLVCPECLAEKKLRERLEYEKHQERCNQISAHLRKGPPAVPHKAIDTHEVRMYYLRCRNELKLKFPWWESKLNEAELDEVFDFTAAYAAIAEREHMEAAARLTCDYCKVEKAKPFANIFVHWDKHGNMFLCGAQGIWIALKGAK